MSSRQLHFVGIGPQKTASSWLHAQLSVHPSLHMPTGTKETFFWDREYDKGLDWYWRFFDASDEALFGEVGPTFFTSRESLERLSTHNPECRIIVTLRDPVDRAVSHFHHYRRQGYVRGSFDEAVQEFPEIIEASHYQTYLPWWIEKFGRENLLVILMDDIRDDAETTLSRISSFLQIETMMPPATGSERVNVKRESRWPVVSSILRQIATWMREHHVFWPLQMAKRLGVKRLYERENTETSSQDQPVIDRNRLLETFSNDVIYVENLLERELANWR